MNSNYNASMSFGVEGDEIEKDYILYFTGINYAYPNTNFIFWFENFI